jgi:hypothetical protein
MCDIIRRIELTIDTEYLAGLKLYMAGDTFQSMRVKKIEQEKDALRCIIDTASIAPSFT